MAVDFFQGRGATGRSERPGTQRRSEIIEKNYFYIKGDQLPTIDLRETAAGTGGKKYFGKLLLTVTAQQDLFLGSGEVEERNRQLYDAFSYYKKEAGQPVKIFTLPGSSLKGCILTHLYLFLNEASAGFFSASNKKDSDDMAKVFFSDFPISESIEGKPRTIAGRFTPRLEPPPNARLKMYRKDDGAYGNLSQAEMRDIPSKENILAVKQGSTFKGFINFKLLTLHELLFLVLSLGCCREHGYCFKVGGARNRGMGLVRMELDMKKSLYANGLKELSLGQHRSLEELEPGWLAELAQLKQRYPRILQAVKIMQQEYGEPS